MPSFWPRKALDFFPFEGSPLLGGVEGQSKKRTRVSLRLPDNSTLFVVGVFRYSSGCVQRPIPAK